MGSMKENDNSKTTALTDIETAVDGLEALLGTTNTNIAAITTSLGTTIGASLIAAVNALTAATNGTSFIPIPLQTLFEGDGTTTVAALGPSTTPTLTLAGGTDPNQLVTWVASNSDPVLFQVALPPNWPATANIEIHFRAKEGVNTDHPAMTLHTAFDEGDTQVVDTSAAITNTTYAEYTITIANADIKAGAQSMSCELTPGTHATESNTVIMSALWVEIVLP